MYLGSCLPEDRQVLRSRMSSTIGRQTQYLGTLSGLQIVTALKSTPVVIGIQEGGHHIHVGKAESGESGLLLPICTEKRVKK